MRFEYPFNERVRTWIRLEYLLNRLVFFSAPGDARLHQVAFSTLFDVLDATERTDIKGGLLQDLERQKITLIGLQNHPGVDGEALQDVVKQIDVAMDALLRQGKTGQTLRTNEWLCSLRGRLAVPGGGTQVDMPSFYAWQCKDVEQRCRDLQDWVNPLLPLRNGVQLIMKLLRDSGTRESTVARSGSYQQMLSGKTYQLFTVWVDDAQQVFPEMSANKYMVWVRFSEQDGIHKPHPVSRDIPFEYALCGF
ncbi:cell division protein ZapD [Orrella sp. 11846]|uniref:cell division protein ZapD n=1 Tax=Orrella sp. 11846 TaxID=3409913 RepID=UPI003B5BCEA2